MTSGLVPPADDQPNGSSTAPTDGPPNDPRGTELTAPNVLLEVQSLRRALTEVYHAGWNTARPTTLEKPPVILWEMRVDRKTKQLNVTALVVEQG